MPRHRMKTDMIFIFCSGAWQCRQLVPPSALGPGERLRRALTSVMVDEQISNDLEVLYDAIARLGYAKGS